MARNVLGEDNDSIEVQIEGNLFLLPWLCQGWLEGKRKGGVQWGRGEVDRGIGYKGNIFIFLYVNAIVEI